MSNLIVNKNLCSKTGECVDICPSVFEIGSDGYAHVKPGADTSHPAVEMAIASCVSGAIYWE